MCMQLKIFAAALTHKWLIYDYKWLFESEKVGKFVDEGNYGVQYFNTPFSGRKFYMAPSFLKEHETKQLRIDNCKMLVETFGKGSFVQSLDKATYVLRASNDKTTYSVPSVDWVSFIRMIIPTSAKTPSSRSNTLLSVTSSAGTGTRTTLGTSTRRY
ncbi:hypothetical protein BKA69DRAFT_745412 [Paraphysoderma sedebokerense]|nr:hypothetical protein BKA69DRAFT_745412 [Paraphysoderma sedebokerense]